MKLIWNLFTKINYMLTGEFHPRNQCDATKDVSKSCQVSCIYFKNHFGVHSFEKSQPKRGV